MKVVFVALGATRRPAVVAESRRVIDAGGTVTVLLNKRDAWAKTKFPKGVKVVELSELERRYRPDRVTRLLFRLPARLFRLFTPGPLRRVGDRLDNAFQRRVTRPLDKRLARNYRRDTATVRRGAVRQAVVGGGTEPDLVVVADAQSLAPVAELVSTGPGRRLDVAFYGPVTNEAG